ncbi:NACHT domain-containing protein [Streptomyces sp. NPDC096339]|uniref:NACHT domain-containing protein n=1 Tax=Streptomyces sp. NPDC096339 TaxID=3366086 RepID=UPI003817B28A
MTGFETVLLRVAGTAAGALVRSLLSRAPGAGLAKDPARPAQPWRRPTELGHAEVRRLADALAARLGPACAELPEHERLAALDAVADAFAALGPLDAEALFAADLDPLALAAAVLAHTPSARLNDQAEAVYRELVQLCCGHAVEYMTTLPGFDARTNVELIRRTGDLSRTLSDVREWTKPQHAASIARFEARYVAYVAETHGRLELFGVTFSRPRQDWPLNLAYISLAVTGEGEDFFPVERGLNRRTVKVEEALSGTDRILLRGPAGSGKTTLVDWLALNAAQRSFGPQLRDLNACIPFVLRLRSFASEIGLPAPEDWLRTSGVPFTPPDGWIEDVLSGGRALVLIDGVDEVPQQLREKAENWLRSMIAAYPQARYVVTTRPSAVPNDWLARQRFTSHLLLPMEGSDVQSFVSHWHEAVRSECPSADERDRLDAYEDSLMRAVTSRQDLGRLATNPLMCALLCALNRDRRMQLPRARKELYDAALDMLLVRRDSEREINQTEGVHLGREEQTLLLQRLAYWLIRNGKVEVSRGSVVEMVGEWMGGMRHVDGAPSQVFRHLLNRSGLLREPTPGSVDFVHRTFQDYLGAKAAVEDRDLGVLVRNAHDDTWHDVIRMAVGHARVGERAELLHALMDKAQAASGRERSQLVVLVAACLEHAPELSPDTRSQVEDFTSQLLPPKDFAAASELATVGEPVLELLPDPAGLDAYEAASTVVTAWEVGGPRALGIIARFREDNRPLVVNTLIAGWDRFDLAEYTDAVLAHAALSDQFLMMETSEHLHQFDRLPHATKVNLRGNHGLPSTITNRRTLEGLVLDRNQSLTDLAPLARLDRLTDLSLSRCPGVRDLSPLSNLPLKALSFSRIPDYLSLAWMYELDTLNKLALNYVAPIQRLADLPTTGNLSSLTLWSEACHISLDGIDRWPDLKHLAISGETQSRRLHHLPTVPTLTSLQLMRTQVEPELLLRHNSLRLLRLTQCSFAVSLEPLRDLYSLRVLEVGFSETPVDLSPLANVDQLTIEIYGGGPVTGIEAIPPERIRFL